MHIVRVNHKNGLYLEFLFLDPGRADVCAKTLAEARLRGNTHPPKDAACEVHDDTGRVTWLDGSLMQSVQMADLVDEVRLNTRMRILIDETTKQYLRDMGFIDPSPVPKTASNGQIDQPDDFASAPLPAIGHFSS